MRLRTYYLTCLAIGMLGLLMAIIVLTVQLYAV